MSTLAETTLIVKRLSSAYGQQADIERARAYHQALGNYPRMVLAEAATISLTRGSQFLPKPVELIGVIQRENLVARWAGSDRYDERAFWLAYAKGITSSDEFVEADIDQIFAGMTGYEPYKDNGKRLSGNLDKFRDYYDKIKVNEATK